MCRGSGPEGDRRVPRGAGHGLLSLVAAREGIGHIYFPPSSAAREPPTAHAPGERAFDATDSLRCTWYCCVRHQGSRYCCTLSLVRHKVCVVSMPLTVGLLLPAVVCCNQR